MSGATPEVDEAPRERGDAGEGTLPARGVPIAAGESDCPGCGFELGASIVSGTPRCPECGREFQIGVVQHRSGAGWHWLAFAVTMALGGAVFNLIYGQYNELVFGSTFPDVGCDPLMLGPGLIAWIVGGVCLWLQRRRGVPTWVLASLSAVLLLGTLSCWLVYADWC